MLILNTAEARLRFSELIGRAAFGGETIVIQRNGRVMAVLQAPPEGFQVPAKTRKKP